VQGAVEEICAMTPDEAVALSFALLSDLRRSGLTDRLLADDPNLVELARSLMPRATAARADAASRGIQVVGWNEPAFPSALLTLSDVPPALWYRGRLDVLNATAVAVVGSRAASPIAIETATRIASDLASRGITVVSGLARGIDSAAHRGALQTGRTAAVLGSGFDHMYPAEHESLAAEIAIDGVVLSEYPPDTPPLPLLFPLRNRLISGLSRAVVVIEANEKSGSLITAACALEQGREVMAVPGNVLSGRSRGAHALIRDGAKIVECADDIVEELCGLASRGQPHETALSSTSSGVSDDPIVAGMEAGHAYDVDGLAELSGLANVQLLSRLIDLELQGRVRRVGGGRFMRC
jgi:DNA processing protein